MLSTGLFSLQANRELYILPEFWSLVSDICEGAFVFLKTAELSDMTVSSVHTSDLSSFEESAGAVSSENEMDTLEEVKQEEVDIEDENEPGVCS